MMSQEDMLQEAILAAGVFFGFYVVPAFVVLGAIGCIVAKKVGRHQHKLPEL